MGISDGGIARARRWWVMACLCLGCASAAPPPSAPPAAGPRQPTRVLPRDSVLVLEAWGASPNDTAVTFALGAGRVVILRHGPPDNTVFAQLAVPPDSGAGSQDSLRVAVRPRPGLYGVDIEASRPLARGTMRRFRAGRFAARQLPSHRSCG